MTTTEETSTKEAAQSSLSTDIDRRPEITIPRFLPRGISQNNEEIRFGERGDYAPQSSSDSHDLFEDQLFKENLRLKSSPNNPVILNRIGLIYLKNQRLTKARDAFKRAYSSDRKFFEPAHNLAQVYVMLGAFTQADKIYSEIIPAISSHPTVVMEYVFLKILMQDLSDAKNKLLEINASYKNYHEVLNTLGLVYALQNESDAAIREYRRAIELNKGYAPAYNNQGVVYIQRSDFKRAEEFYKKAIELDKNYLDARLNLYHLTVVQNDLKAALDQILALEKFEHARPEILFKIGWTLMVNDKYEDAIEYYDRYLLYDTDNSSSLNNIGVCILKLGDMSSAEKYFESSIKADGRNEKAVVNLIAVSIELGHSEKAYHLANQRILFYKDDFLSLYAIGSFWAENENWDKAIEFLEHAYKVNPTSNAVVSTLSFVYMEVFGRVEDAIKLLLPRYKVDVQDFRIANNLAHAYLLSNKTDEAGKVLENRTELTPIELATKGLYVLMSLGDVDQARKLFMDGYDGADDKLKPRVLQRMHYDIGMYYLDNGKVDQGKRELDEALRVEKGNEYIRDLVRERLGLKKTSSGIKSYQDIV